MVKVGLRISISAIRLRGRFSLSLRSIWGWCAFALKRYRKSGTLMASRPAHVSTFTYVYSDERVDVHVNGRGLSLVMHAIGESLSESAP